jgi:hypothetical protein
MQTPRVQSDSTGNSKLLHSFFMRLGHSEAASCQDRFRGKKHMCGGEKTMFKPIRVSLQTRRNWLVHGAVFLGGVIAALSGFYFLFLPAGGYHGGRNPWCGVDIIQRRRPWSKLDIHTLTKENKMLKKIAVGVLLAGLIGIVVTGAIVRTADGMGKAADMRGLEHSQGRAENPSCGQGWGYGGRVAEAAGRTRGGFEQDAAAVKGQFPNYKVPAEDWITYEGTVVQAPGDGDDLIIQTESGDQITVGAGPGYMEAQGFTLQVGEPVQVHGFWDGGQFKVLR